MKSTFVVALLATFTLAGCEGDFRTEPTRPRPTRALAPNVEHNSWLGEMNSGTNAGTPILRVELPNTKEEQVRVRTIADPEEDRPRRSQRPAASTGSGGATTAPAR